MLPMFVGDIVPPGYALLSDRRCLQRVSEHLREVLDLEADLLEVWPVLDRPVNLLRGDQVAVALDGAAVRRGQVVALFDTGEARVRLWDEALRPVEVDAETRLRFMPEGKDYACEL